MTPQEIIDVITAYNDGKQIEYRGILENTWYPADKPKWNFISFTFRIAPKQTKVLYQFLVKEGSYFHASSTFFSTLEEAKNYYNKQYQTIVPIQRLDYTKCTIEE